jgi:hypothetical protein
MFEPSFNLQPTLLSMHELVCASSGRASFKRLSVITKNHNHLAHAFLAEADLLLPSKTAGVSKLLPQLSRGSPSPNHASE